MKFNILFLTLDDIEVLKFITYSLEESLADTSIVILEAKNDKDAIKLLKTTKINLIITDMNINTIEPYEFHDNLQLTPEYKNIPFIFLSSDEEDGIIVVSKGNSDFFLKPLNINKLIDTLHTILIDSEFDHNFEYSSNTKNRNRKSYLEMIDNNVQQIEELVQSNCDENKEKINTLTSNIKELIQKLSSIENEKNHTLS
jgi:response regulator RpfG family c-di-GMP phosphodiesterase